MNRVGSSTNGSTNRDRTNYFEVVPRDALEKAIWAESDKLGFFINTVTQSVVDKERQVVKNEKRQGVDNQPYGHASYVIDRALYPEDFHVRNIQDRLARVGDPFASFFAQPQSLAPLLDGGRLRRVRPLA